MSNYLVTGGAGFIGSHIVRALVERGETVRVLDNLSTGTLENLAEVASDVEVVEADLNDASAVARAVTGVDCIFHEAALASVPLSVANPVDTNRACVSGTVNLLDQARLAGVRRLVYAGSSSCYGDRPYTAKREIDLAAPLSPYAAAKYAGEMYCEAFGHTYDIETVCLRYFNVFGPRQDPASPYSAVIPLFITAILRGESPVIYGDGLQSRDFTFVQNIVHGNLLASESPEAPGGTFNIAMGKSFSLLTLIAAINEMLGTDIQPTFEPARVGDVRDSLADISQATARLKYEPQVEFSDGLKRSLDYYRKLCETTRS